MSYLDVQPPMADLNDPKKETVRIIVSRQPSSPPSPPTESRDTVRSYLPTRPPANPPSSSADSPSPARATAAAMTAPAPKKETARIAVLSDPPKPPVQMKKTQPLIDLPAIEIPSSTVTVTPKSPLRIDQIPTPLCWALLGASAAILILQIWNYVS